MYYETKFFRDQALRQPPKGFFIACWDWAKNSRLSKSAKLRLNIAVVDHCHLTSVSIERDPVEDRQISSSRFSKKTTPDIHPCNSNRFH